MSTRELIDKEIAELSEPLRQEVYEFIRFLRQNRAQKPIDVGDGWSEEDVSNVTAESLRHSSDSSSNEGDNA